MDNKNPPLLPMLAPLLVFVAPLALFIIWCSLPSSTPKWAANTFFGMLIVQLLFIYFAMDCRGGDDPAAEENRP